MIKFKMQASTHYNTPSLAYLKPFWWLYFKYSVGSGFSNNSWGNSQDTIACPCLYVEYALVKKLIN